MNIQKHKVNVSEKEDKEEEEEEEDEEINEFSFDY